MATYYNKNLIDGVSELPRMTQAEFDELSLDEKPINWICRNYTGTQRGIKSSDIEHGTGTVEDAIDGLGNTVSGLKTIAEGIKTYTSDQHGHFQFGSDFNYGKNIIQVFCLNRQSNRMVNLYTWNSGMCASLSDGGGTQIANETNDYRVVYFT